MAWRGRRPARAEGHWARNKNVTNSLGKAWKTAESLGSKTTNRLGQQSIGLYFIGLNFINHDVN